jgi:hypothetical protein
MEKVFGEYHVFSIAAIGMAAGALEPLTQVLPAFPAEAAVAATGIYPGASHLFLNLESGCFSSHFFNDAHRLFVPWEQTGTGDFKVPSR